MNLAPLWRNRYFFISECQTYVWSSRLTAMTPFNDPNSIFPPIIKTSFDFTENMLAASNPRWSLTSKSYQDDLLGSYTSMSLDLFSWLVYPPKIYILFVYIRESPVDRYFFIGLIYVHLSKYRVSYFIRCCISRNGSLFGRLRCGLRRHRYSRVLHLYSRLPYVNISFDS